MDRFDLAFGVVIGLSLLLLGVVWGAETQRNIIMKDCDKIGSTIIDDRVYQCAQEGAEARIRAIQP